uniref:Uncharacterized protein n=1 Tax=Globodera pallida TaxID=36090 RepID=A0A183BRG3_GLOPA
MNDADNLDIQNEIEGNNNVDVPGPSAARQHHQDAGGLEKLNELVSQANVAELEQKQQQEPIDLTHCQHNNQNELCAQIVELQKSVAALTVAQKETVSFEEFSRVQAKLYELEQAQNNYELEPKKQLYIEEFKLNKMKKDLKQYEEELKGMKEGMKELNQIKEALKQMHQLIGELAHRAEAGDGAGESRKDLKFIAFDCLMVNHRGYWGLNGYCIDLSPIGPLDNYWSLIEFGVRIKRHAPYYGLI